MEPVILSVIAACTVLVVIIGYVKLRRYLLSASSQVRTSRNESATPSSFSITGGLVREKTTAISNTYELSKKVLGRGASAEVLIGTHIKSRRQYAIKVIDIVRPDIQWRYDREKSIMKDMIDHTNVVRLFEVYKNLSRQYFVMELCTGGHLGQVLRNQSEGKLEQTVAKRYIIQIVQAIAHCHKHGICHRDIKLQNILLENKGKDAQIKLIDFGNGHRFRGNLPMKKIVGTTYTAAPEVFKECYDERCDIWSIGVVSYILLSGRRPFESLDIPKEPKAKDSSLIASILMGRYHFMHDTWEDVDSAAIHYVKSCLEMNYQKRRTANQLLEHPWLAFDNLHRNIGAGISKNGANLLSRRLSRNLSSTGLRRTSMVAVAFQMPTKKANLLRSLFQEIDVDGTGSVDKDEFAVAMNRVDPTLGEADLKVLFEAMDLDGDGEISFIEFMAATVDPREVDIQELSQAFQLLDTDGKGYITKDDLKRLLETNDNALPINYIEGVDGEVQQESMESHQRRMKKLNRHISHIIDKADVNKDGVVSYTEFLFAMADGMNVDNPPVEDIHDISITKSELMQGSGSASGPSPLHISARNLQEDEMFGEDLFDVDSMKSPVYKEDVSSSNDSDNKFHDNSVNDSTTSPYHRKPKLIRRQSDSHIKWISNNHQKIHGNKKNMKTEGTGTQSSAMINSSSSPNVMNLNDNEEINNKMSSRKGFIWNTLAKAATFLGFFSVENFAVTSERRRSIVMMEDSSDSSLSNEFESLEAGYNSKSGIAIHKSYLLRTMGIFKDNGMKTEAEQPYVDDDNHSVSSSSSSSSSSSIAAADASGSTSTTKRKSIVSSIAEYLSIGSENNTNIKKSIVSCTDNSYNHENKDMSNQSNSVSEADKVSELVSVAKMKTANLSNVDYPTLTKGLLGDSGLLSVDTCEIESISDSNIPSSRKSSKDSTIGGGSGNQSQQELQAQHISDRAPIDDISNKNNENSVTVSRSIKSFPRMERRASII